MKKRIIALFFAAAMLCGVHGSAMATTYLQEKEKPISMYRDDDLHIDPVDRSSIPTTWSTRSTIPSSYESPYVTSVKDQNPYGSCWAHAFIGASEASLVQEGLASSGANEVDLSELHLAYFMYHAVADPLGGTAGDGFYLNSTATNAFLNEGGNQKYATYFVSNWYGLVDEDVAPYNSVVSGEEKILSDELAYSKDLYHLENAYWVSMQDRETVKKLIMEHGACGASYRDEEVYYNVSNPWYLNEKVAIYCPNDLSTNHAITIVGWDDDYSVDKFGTYKPSSNGAWLCKNSWSADYSEDGYFWLSYEDVPLNNGVAFFYDYDTADNYDRNYQYDGGAFGTSYGCNYEANIYTAQADEYIKAVGFYTSDSNYDCKVKVYKNCVGENPASGTLLTTLDADQLYAGFHTVELDDSYLIRKGETFSVVVYQNTTDGEQTWISVDASYSGSDAWFHNVSVATSGQSFVSNSLASWTDISDTDYNCRIKAYTDLRIPVTAVEVDKETLTLYTGEMKTLSATVAPDDASEKEVTWSSSDSTVATVDENGVVTAKKAGTATITCKSNELDAVESQCTVTVKQWVEGVTLDIVSGKLLVGEPLSLTATISPTDATDKSLQWTSSNTDVVTVSDTGKVTAVGYGTATVTCTATDRSTYSASCEISVCERIDSITLEDVKVVYVGDSKQLEYSVTPAMEQTKGVTWSTSAEDVVTVDSTGKITANKAGTAIITCKSNDTDALKAQCIVTVKQWVESISLDTTSGKLLEDETLTLAVAILPADATDKSLKWTSSNTDIVTVSDTGKVTAVGYGTATVTCTATDRGICSASCEISVCGKINSITLEEEKVIYAGTSEQLVYDVMPAIEKTKGVTWSTSAEDIVTVDGTGKITANKAGTAMITCKSNDVDAVTAQCIVTVKQWVEGVRLNVTSGKLLEGETLSLKATISPVDATNKSLQWTSSNTDVATVSDTGEVTAAGYGTAMVTCTATDRRTYSATCVVSVRAKVKSITLEKSKEINVGDSFQLEYSITPAVEQTKGVIWSSSVEGVVVVDNKGKITAKKPGTAVITCRANDSGAVKAQCVVTVKEPIVVREKGDVIKDSVTNAEYKVATSGTTGATVQFVKGTNCSGTVTVPESITMDGVTYKVTTIAANAFKGNSKITKVIIKDNITSIGKNAFYGCKNLTSITLGDSVKTIGDNSFYNCKKLKTVTIGKNTQTIGNKAFYQCSKLSKIVIPSKVTKIGKQAFYKCKSLKSITIKTTKLSKKKVGSKAFKGIHSKATIKVPKKKLKSYKSILKLRGIGRKVKVKKY